VNATTAVRPEVAAFVVQVRQHLSDLTDEECEELVGGLEADLSEQAADGALVLPDPAQYAAELRAAAGLPVARRTGLPRFASTPWGQWPDAARARWLALTERSAATRQGWALLETLRPAWWVLRAWVAVTLLDQLSGPWEYVSLWPTLGVSALGPVLLAAAVVVSVLVGQGKLWPGSGPDRTTLARFTLLSLNVLAVLAPLTFSGDGSHVAGYTAVAAPYREPVRPVLRYGDDVVRNIYAYDAAGQPLLGVQLFDQRGRQVAVAPESSMGEGRERRVTCPWANGATPLFNVFPLRERLQPRGTCLDDRDPATAGEPSFSEPPLASVPPATLSDLGDAP
jgi:hypothetical protein